MLDLKCRPSYCNSGFHWKDEIQVSWSAPGFTNLLCIAYNDPRRVLRSEFRSQKKVLEHGLSLWNSIGFPMEFRNFNWAFFEIYRYTSAAFLFVFRKKKPFKLNYCILKTSNISVTYFAFKKLLKSTVIDNKTVQTSAMKPIECI